jgi:uncharacterized protein YuzB (UPF0349 family)
MKHNLVVRFCMMFINKGGPETIHAIHDHDLYLDIIHYLRLKTTHNILQVGSVLIFRVGKEKHLLPWVH